MRYSWISAVVVSLFCRALLAQTQPSTAEQMLNQMLQPTQTPAPPTTSPDSAKPLQPQGFVASAGGPKLLREGSDVIARTGHLRKIPDSPYSQFVFDQMPKESALAPMFVMPNLQLMSMEDAASATKEDLKFTVSGMVTEYKDNNYILLEPGPDDVGQQMPSTSDAMDKIRGPASADQMLKEMLTADQHPAAAAPRAMPLETDRTSGPGALPPNAPALAVLPEQTQIFDRVCRMGPSSDAQEEELTLESDGSALQDPPLIVLPNLKLMDLEGAAKDHRDTRYRITGIVTEYRGRNYILLQKVVVMADTDRQF